MNKPSTLEACFKKYMKDIIHWLPDGIIQVDLDLLHQLDLLHYYNKNLDDPTLTRYFHVMDSEDKITLINEKFVVWIVPDKIGETAATYTLIALNKYDSIQLELGFVTTGIYNHSRLVLRLLERFLLDIEITEDVLSKL